MKKYFVSLMGILMLFFATLNAADKIYTDNYEKGLQKAQKEDKILMLMISQSDCPMCIYMKNNTLKDANVSAYLSRYYVPVEVELNDKKYPAKFDTFVTPTFFFIDPKTGEKLDDPFRGGAKAPVFLELLKQYQEFRGETDD